jgi:NADH-quinone oxidoreductase subunit E
MSHSTLEESIASHETPGNQFYTPFAVTTELEAEADERISHYPASKRSATLPLLHIVQHKFGYISAQS